MCGSDAESRQPGTPSTTNSTTTPTGAATSNLGKESGGTALVVFVLSALFALGACVNSATTPVGAATSNPDKEGGRPALVVSILSALFALGSCAFAGFTYWSQWVDHPSLTVNPFVSTEINTALHLAATVEASNIGNETIVVGDFGLMALVGTLGERPNCRNRNVLTQIENQTYNPSSEQAQNDYLIATEVQTETNRTNTHGFAVSPNQVVTRIFHFDLSTLPWSGGAQEISLCPVLQYMEPSGRVTEAICHGWELASVMTNGQIRLRMLNTGPKAVTLLPSVNEALCASIQI